MFSLSISFLGSICIADDDDDDDDGFSFFTNIDDDDGDDDTVSIVAPTMGKGGFSLDSSSPASYARVQN